MKKKYSIGSSFVLIYLLLLASSEQQQKCYVTTRKSAVSACGVCAFKRELSPDVCVETGRPSPAK
jgi:hypothetical protein